MYHNIFDSDRYEALSCKDNIFAQFLLEKGLYDTMEITEENISDLIMLFDGQVRISSYCKECKTERVFSMVPIIFYFESRDGYIQRKLSDEVSSLQKSIFSKEYCIANNEEWGWKNWQIDEVARVIVFKFVCSMNDNHHLDFIVLTDNRNFRKIGQYPSVADLTFPELDTYKKVMSTGDRREFGRALGLYASGIGAGSYVYLRRIFERLLMEAKKMAGSAIDDKEFNKAHVNEKIAMLSDYLPNTLTSNPTIYGILSKGIHELSEAECLAYFPVLKECIYMILGEWDETRKKKEQETALTSALSKITANIK